MTSVHVDPGDTAYAAVRLWPPVIVSLSPSHVRFHATSNGSLSWLTNTSEGTTSGTSQATSLGCSSTVTLTSTLDSFTPNHWATLVPTFASAPPCLKTSSHSPCLSSERLLTMKTSYMRDSRAVAPGFIGGGGAGGGGDGDGGGGGESGGSDGCAAALSWRACAICCDVNGGDLLVEASITSAARANCVTPAALLAVATLIADASARSTDRENAGSSMSLSCSASRRDVFDVSCAPAAVLEVAPMSARGFAQHLVQRSVFLKRARRATVFVE
mmetsp:Transcript_18571/g.37839  ORF Transcript_18571/g.37839 Transcript_18571/m.37839 type:complete len:272 (+) Transcript_18571:146-961(+)